MFRPQIGAFGYFVMSIMAPQFIWPWVFEGVPAFTLVAGSTILAFGLAVLTKKVDLSIYLHRQNILLMVMFVFVNMSVILTPFQDYRALTSSDLVLDVFNTIIIMYFVSLPLLAKEEHLKVITFMFIGVMIYYVYWSNDQYFNFNPKQFGFGMRLAGPLKGPYRDQNVFSTVFVVGMPFLLFGFFYFKNIFVKALLAGSLLFLWHSIFLTGSRGGLLSTAVATLFAYTLIKSRTFGILLIVGFIVALVDQGGQLMDRTTDTIESSQVESEKPIDPRIQSWITGTDLIKMYPIFGVGVQRFQQATRVHFPDRNPYVAHNTFFQFASNTGLICGIIFFYFYYMHYRNFRFARNNGVENYPFLHFLNNSIMTSLTGFYVAAMFLDLMIFEGFYFLLMIGLLRDYVFRQKLNESEQQEPDNKQVNQPARELHA